MTNLTPQRANKIADIVEQGQAAIARYLFELEDDLEKKKEELENQLKEIKETIPNVKDILNLIKGKDGYTPKKGVDYEDGIKGAPGDNYILTNTDKKEIASMVKVPIVEKIIEKTEIIKEQPIVTNQIIKEITMEMRDTGDDIVKKINNLPIETDCQINKDHIKGLDDELKRIESRVSVGKGGARKVPIVKRVSLTSQVDGNKRSFTLPRDTVNIIGLWGTSFPVTFDDADWTIAGNTITLASGLVTPQSGQTLVAIVEVLFYG